MSLSQIAVIVVVALFAAYIVVQVRPGLGRDGGLGREIESARKRARSAESPASRADALAQAGALAAKARRWGSAGAYFLRALRADPASAELVRRVQTELGGRPRLAEKLFLRRLAALSREEGMLEAEQAIVDALVELYEGPLRQRGLAALARKAAGAPGKTGGQKKG